MTGLRVADAFRAPDDPPGVTDADFELTCTCGLSQRLDAALLEELREVTFYDCSRCENTVAAILTDRAAEQLRAAAGVMARRTSGFGTSRNGFLIGARVDLALRPPDGDMDDAVLILASPDFFDALRNM